MGVELGYIYGNTGSGCSIFNDGSSSLNGPIWTTFPTRVSVHRNNYGPISVDKQIEFTIYDLQNVSSNVVFKITAEQFNLLSPNSDTVIYENIVPPHTVTRPLMFLCRLVDAEPECYDNTDCPQGEKCSGGECVPCEKTVDLLGQFIAYNQAKEFFVENVGWVTEEHVFDVGNKQSAFRITSPNGLHGDCEIYQEIGILGMSGAGAYYREVGNKAGLVGEQYYDFIINNTDIPFGYLPTGNLKVIFHSNFAFGDCADHVEPSEPPPIEDLPADPPVLPEEPEEPEQPEEPQEPEEPTIPEEPTEPEEPQGVCECEIYLGKIHKNGFKKLFDAINSLNFNLSEQISYLVASQKVLREEIVKEIYFKRLQDYKLQSFIMGLQYQLFLANKESFDKAFIGDSEGFIKRFEKAQILPECGEEPERGLVEIIDQARNEYQPALIEVLEDQVILNHGDNDEDIIPRRIR